MFNNRILIIDDEEIVRDSIQRTLRKYDYELFFAENGLKGLEIFRKVEPVLIILDLKMPVMDGFGFLKEIQPSPADPYAVLVLTGHGSDKDTERCFDLGISSFLRKPFNIYELKGTVKQTIALKKAEAELSKYCHSLESKVEERTSRLSALNKQLSLEIEERKRVDKELIRSFDLQRTINSILELSLEDISLSQLLETVLHRLLELPGFSHESRGAVFLVEDAPDRLIMKAQKGMSEESIEKCRDVPFGKCLCGKAAASGRQLFSDCITELHEIKESDPHPHGHYCIPIISDGAVLGLINITLQEGAVRERLEEGFLDSVSRAVAGVILRKRVEEALKLSEENFQAIVDRNTDGIIIINDDGVVQYSNPVVKKLFGKKAEIVEGVVFGFPIVNEKKTEVDIIRTNGEIGIAEMSVSTTRWWSKPAKLVTLHDVTERKMAEKKLELAAKISENILEGVVVTDIEGNIQMINPSFETITGYSIAEVSGKTLSILKSGRHDPAFYNEMWDALKVHGKWQGEIWNRHKNGVTYAEWLSITAIKDERGLTTHYVGIFSDITERKLTEERFRYYAYTDILTGLANRLLFKDRLEQALSHAERNNRSIALMFLDLDNFKHVNDTAGHDTGDLLLKEVAFRLKRVVRKTDTVARMGGDEFTIILFDLDEPEDSAGIAQKILSFMNQPFILKGKEYAIGASLGISIYPVDGGEPDILIKNADLALYQAKENGKNHFRFYTTFMN